MSRVGWLTNLGLGRYPCTSLLLLVFVSIAFNASVLPGATVTSRHDSEGRYKPRKEGYEQHPQSQGPSQGAKDYQSQHEASYADAKHSCPHPQPPDEVKQVYIKHTTFNWAKWAEEYAAGKRGVRRAPRPEQRRRPVKPGVQRTPVRGRISSNSSLATTAFVTNPDFLSTTSLTETGVGFHGTSDVYVPDEAIAVAEHPSNPGQVIILHGINAALEIFVANRTDGKRIPSEVPTKISTDDILYSLDLPGLYDSDPNAWFDPKEQRWVVLFTTVDDGSGTTEIQPPLIVAVSQSSNPLGDWTVWALQPGFDISPGFGYCSDLPPASFLADYPQATYSDDGVFISVGAFCGDNQYVATLFAYSKKALYSLPPANIDTQPDILAAVYLAPTAWYRSLPPGQLGSDEAPGYTPINNFIQPARPQDPEDMSAQPLFVMKVDNSLMSVAMLTQAPLDHMTSVSNAPWIMAQIFSKGADFSNLPGQSDGGYSMAQPGTEVVLDAGDLGMMDRDYAVRSYWAMQHQGTLYLTTLEYFGVGDIANRQPSTYWAIVEPSTPNLCEVHRKDWGLLASAEGLALTYPVIAARKEAPGAVLAYSYGGSGTISGGRYPAYAGVATSVITTIEGKHSKQSQPPVAIEIVQRGPGVIPDRTPTSNKTRLFQRWGDYSAAQVLNGQMWYAVIIPIPYPEIGYWKGSWIGVVDL